MSAAERINAPQGRCGSPTWPLGFAAGNTTPEGKRSSQSDGETKRRRGCEGLERGDADQNRRQRRQRGYYGSDATTTSNAVDRITRPLPENF